MVISVDIANYRVKKVFIGNDSSVNVLFLDVLQRMELDTVHVQPISTPLAEFGGAKINPIGSVDLPLSMEMEPYRKTLMVKFLVVDLPFTYNMILGRPALNLFKAIISI